MLEALHRSDALRLAIPGADPGIWKGGGGGGTVRGAAPGRVREGAPLPAPEANTFCMRCKSSKNYATEKVLFMRVKCMYFFTRNTY